MKILKRTLLEFIIAFVFLYFLLKHLNDGEKILFLVRQSRWEYLLLALVFQVISYAFYVFLYQKAFGIYGIVWSFGKITRLVLSATAVSLLAPFGSLAGVGIFVHSAKRGNFPSVAVGASLFTVIFADFFALFLFLTPSMALLFLYHSIFKYELFGYAAFTVIVFLLTSFSVLGFRNVGVLRAVLRVFYSIINKLGNFLLPGRTFPSQNWFRRKTGEFKEVSSKLAGAKYKFGNLIVLAVLMRVSSITALFFLFLAFRHLVGVVPLFVGYSIGMLFLIISPTPQGIGVVESVMPVVFSSLGVGIEVATLVTLVFRGLTVWAPAFFGFIALRYTVHKN